MQKASFRLCCMPADTIEEMQKTLQGCCVQCPGLLKLCLCNFQKTGLPRHTHIHAQADRLASHVDSKLWPEVDHAITTANRMGGPQRPYVRQLLTPALRMMDTMLERAAPQRISSMLCTAGIKGRGADQARPGQGFFETLKVRECNNPAVPLQLHLISKKAVQHRCNTIHGAYPICKEMLSVRATPAPEHPKACQLPPNHCRYC
eukprot:874799-Pelagomonas_calceolata.AAC.2